MISVLEAMYNGQVIPWERHIQRTDEHIEIEKKIVSEKQYFADRLSKDDYQRLVQLEKLYMSASHYEDSDLYSYGFTLGALLMLEVLERGENIIYE